MRSTQWVDARKKPETYCRRLRTSDTADARWLQAAPEHLSVTQHYRQCHCECGALLRHTFHVNMTLVGTYGGLGQAEAQAIARTGSAFITPIESLEDVRQFVRTDAYPIVLNLQ